MGQFVHMISFMLYGAVAAAIGVAGPQFIPALDQMTAVLIGLVVFLAFALLQETLARRAESLASVRRLLLLKRVLDRNREDVDVARDEVRRLFEVIEAAGDPRVMAALDAAGLQHPEPEDGRPVRRTLAAEGGTHDDEADAQALFQKMDKQAHPPNRGAAQQPAQRAGTVPNSNPGPNPGYAATTRDRNAHAERSMREAKAEVRILHNLVEQLYAGRDTPPASLSEGATALSNDRITSAAARPQPRFADVPRRPDAEPAQASGAAGSGNGLRAALKVVGGGPASPLPASPLPASPMPGPASAAPRPFPESNADSAILTTVREALRADRVDLYLQPIVSLPQRKRRFYECFSRIRAADGRLLAPNDYAKVVREANLQTAIDNMLLFRCVQLIRRVRRKDFTAAFFCNIAPHTLSDREFFRDFIEYMESHAELAPSLILEFSQSDLGDDFGGVEQDLKRLGGLGYRFSLDNVTDLALDLDLFEQNHFAFVKVDSGTILNRLKKGGADSSAVRALKQDIDGRGIDLIVDRIESEATLLELLDFNIDFGQGYLFGEPRQSKDPAA